MFDYPSWSLFLSAFLSSTLLPGGSEAVLAYLTRAQGHELGWLLAVASVGNTLGGMTSWLVGRIIAMRYSAEQVVSPMVPPTDKSDEGRVTRYEEKQNQPGTVAGRVRGTHPMKLTKARVFPRHASLVPRPSAKAVKRLRLWGAPACGDSGMRMRGTHPAEATRERVTPRHSSLVPRPSPKALERLRRWGAPMLLLSWLPVIGDPLCVAAGWLRIHWLLSLVLIGIGKTARYAVVVFVFM